MTKEFITYEQALALKELGFDDYCYGFYGHDNLLYRYGEVNYTVKTNPTYSLAPLYQQAFKWFRENHQLFQEIQIDQTSSPKFCFKIVKFLGNPINLSEKEWYWEEVKVVDWFLYRTYEEAEQACLDKLIEICKNK